VVTGLPLRENLVAALDASLRSAARSGRRTAALVLEIDGWKLLEERHDRATLERILQATAARLTATLRDGDIAARLDGPVFAVALAPGARLDLEGALQIAGRHQATLSASIPLGDLDQPLSFSVGLALSERLRTPTGERLLRAATLAAIEAQRVAPGALRSYSEALRNRVETRDKLVEEVAGALERGEVTAFFQPQVSVRTGAITGFEALARWHHPSRGLLPPSEFLPAIEQAGLMNRLGHRMLDAALSALRDWERQGYRIPSVGVNFSSVELCEPQLVDRIAWELDRFELSPDRLVVEVLETVVASHSDDAVIRNLAGLARLGCCVDLDDFGTGQASISSIRRFSIERIKIDRSFVSRLDRDPEQSRLVGAIITMAERLGLDTVAEGVETAEEQATLARLGCGHVQGFGIARPMPFDETGPWLRAWSDGRGVAQSRRLRAV
jgi:diguanylate cyclase (GGDEF)-like protein